MRSWQFIIESGPEWLDLGAFELIDLESLMCSKPHVFQNGVSASKQAWAMFLFFKELVPTAWRKVISQKVEDCAKKWQSNEVLKTGSLTLHPVISEQTYIYSAPAERAI